MNKGIFWIICNYELINGNLLVDFSDYKLLSILIPCRDGGDIINSSPTLLNSKKGNSITHKMAWNTTIINDREYSRLLRRYSYNYFPRGRVEITNEKAMIFLNPFIYHDFIISDIIEKFGIRAAKSIKIIADNSSHYDCFQD